MVDLLFYYELLSSSKFHGFLLENKYITKKKTNLIQNYGVSNHSSLLKDVKKKEILTSIVKLVSSTNSDS